MFNAPIQPKLYVKFSFSAEHGATLTLDKQTDVDLFLKGVLPDIGKSGPE